MNLIVIGKGGREHAIAWKLAQDKNVNKVFVIPGSSAIEGFKIESVNIDSLDFNSIIDFAKEKKVDLTIVGPEVELSAGIVDAFEKEGLKIFGPNKYCAQIESSKSFSKEKMIQYGIPTATYITANSKQEALEYLENQSYPIVLKADGLAAGKGVTIPNSFLEAKEIIGSIFDDNKYGTAGAKVVIEEFLVGEEFSLLAFVNDKTISYMQIAQDHKRAFDNDQGENTGGMGAYTPVHQFSKEQINEGEEIIRKMAYGLSDEGHPYTGIIYAGCMATSNGVKTIEFNARFGDPETEVILPAMKDELMDVINKVMNNEEVTIKWHPETFIGVVLASKGYPGKYEVNKLMPELPFENIFYMGAKKVEDKYITNGGRVAFVWTKGNSVKEAQNMIYPKLDKIKSDYLFYRKDIGNKAG